MRKPKYSERNLFHFHNIHSKYFWNWAIFTPNITKTGQYSLQFYRNWAIFTPNITETGQYSLKILLKSGNIHSKYYWNRTIFTYSHQILLKLGNIHSKYYWNWEKFTPNITETGQYSLQILLKPGSIHSKYYWNRAIFTPNITETRQYLHQILLKLDNIHSKNYWNRAYAVSARRTLCLNNFGTKLERLCWRYSKRDFVNITASALLLLLLLLLLLIISETSKILLSHRNVIQVVVFRIYFSRKWAPLKSRKIVTRS